MDKRLRIIQDIPVEADASLSEMEITALVGDAVLSWSWEGRSLGRIELVPQEDGICVYTYEKPQMAFVSKACLLSQSF